MRYTDNERVIIIGNSPSILNNELGSIIDSFDIVIRINRCVTSGFEKYIGSKTDIWSTSSWCLNISPEKKFPDIKSETSKKGLPYFFPPNIEDLRSIWYRTPQTYTGFQKNFKDLFSKIKNNDNYHFLWADGNFRKNFDEFCTVPNMEFIKKGVKKGNRHPRMKISKADFDTGLLTILNSTLFFKDITIHGFDFYSESGGDVTCYYRESEIDSNGNHPEDVAWARAKSGNEYATKFIDAVSTAERKEIIGKLIERKNIKILNV